MKNFLLLFFSILLISFCDSYSQIPQYRLTAENFSLDSGVYRTLEWDVYLLRTGSEPLEYAYAEYYFNFDPSIAQGGTLSFSIISSDLPFELKPFFPMVSVADSRLSMRSYITAQPGEGYIISNVYPGTKIARVRLRTTATSFITHNINPSNELNLSWMIGPALPFTKIKANIGSSLTDITNSAEMYVSPNYYGMFIEETIPWDSLQCKTSQLKRCNRRTL